jgi:hypothetical protein
MSKPVPTDIARQYGGARQFRAKKREQLAALEKLTGELAVGCAYFPGGTAQMRRLEAALDEIGKNLSREVWGQ